jgi:hypothetical protein
MKKKGRIKMAKKIKIKIDEHEFDAEERTFKSGKKGFGLYGKVEIEGDRYQMVINIVKIEK